LEKLRKNDDPLLFIWGLMAAIQRNIGPDFLTLIS